MPAITLATVESLAKGAKRTLCQRGRGLALRDMVDLRAFHPLRRVKLLAFHSLRRVPDSLRNWCCHVRGSWLLALGRGGQNTTTAAALDRANEEDAARC